MDDLELMGDVQPRRDVAHVARRLTRRDHAETVLAIRQ
jgi:hypothetical protein